MSNYSDELVVKLKKAKSLEEVIELLKADGQDIAEAEKLWGEIKVSIEQDRKELSLDELDAVAGGRDWLVDGCNATVEPGSNCWGNDGGCTLFHTQYQHMPDKKQRCIYCGAYVCYLGEVMETGSWIIYDKYACRKCGTFKINPR